jgi:hypothetical protein
VFTTGSTVSGSPLAVRWAPAFPAGDPTADGSDFFGFENVTLDAMPVPEPSSTLLFAGLGRVRRRRKLS